MASEREIRRKSRGTDPVDVWTVAGEWRSAERGVGLIRRLQTDGEGFSIPGPVTVIVERRRTHSGTLAYGLRFIADESVRIDRLTPEESLDEVRAARIARGTCE